MPSVVPRGPGRPHHNGIHNQHVKFRDGTALELITAPAGRDALTTTYRRHLTAGDGPAFLAFAVPADRARSLDVLRRSLRHVAGARHDRNFSLPPDITPAGPT